MFLNKRMNNQKTNNDAVKKSRAKKKKILEDMKGRRSYLKGAYSSTTGN